MELLQLYYKIERAYKIVALVKGKEIKPDGCMT